MGPGASGNCLGRRRACCPGSWQSGCFFACLGSTLFAGPSLGDCLAVMFLSLFFSLTICPSFSSVIRTLESHDRMLDS